MDHKSEEGRLDSWKAIAAFLGREIRTVQRWEALEGMPVHRQMHLKRSSIWAYESELLSWQEERKELTEAGDPAPAMLPPEPLPYPAPPNKSELSRFRCLVLVTLLTIVFAFVLRGIWVHQTAIQPLVLGRLLARGTQEGGRFERIAVGKEPADLAMTPDGHEIYVSNFRDGTVSVIRRETREVTHTLNVSQRPYALTMAPDGRKVFVGSRVSGLSIIDTNSKVVSTIPTGGPINNLAITPDGRRLFLAMTYHGLKRLLVPTGKLESLPVVGCPYDLAIDPPGKRLYVSYRCGGPFGGLGRDAIDVMDLQTEASQNTINGLPLVGGPIVVTANNSQIWVSGSDRCFTEKYGREGCPMIPGGIIHVIRGSDLKLLTTLALLPIQPGSPVLLPSGSRILLTGGQRIDVWDTGNFKALESLANTTIGGHLAFSPDQRLAYVTQNSPDGVLVLEPEPTDCEPLRFGVYHLWAADGNLNDSEGESHGKPNGSLLFAPGRRGQALSLDGTGSVSFTPDRGFFNWSTLLSSNDWTVAAWVKPRTAGIDGVVISRGERKGATWTLGQSKDGHWQFQIGATLLRSKTRVQEGAWRHLAVVHCRTSLSFYVDGVKESETVLSSMPSSTGVAAAIGADPRGERSFSGLIDEIRIHQAALSEPTLRSMVRGDRAVCEATALQGSQ